MMLRTSDSESLLRHDLEGFSRDLLGLHTRFQEMFPVLANSRESASTSAAAQSLAPILGHLRDQATRSHVALPPSPALTPFQSTTDLTSSLEHKVSQEVKAKVKQEIMNIKLRVDGLQQRLNPQGGDLYRNWIQPLQAKNQRVEEELARIGEENMKRQQDEKKTREELWMVIRKMQAEIEELKKARSQERVKVMEVQQEETPVWRDIPAEEDEFLTRNMREMNSPNDRNLAALEEQSFQKSPMELPFANENVQSYTSSALVPFSSQVDKNTDAPNTKELGQHGTAESAVGGLDLTTRPANRGQQGVAGLRNTQRDTSSADSELPVPAPKHRSHSGRRPTRLASESDDEPVLELTTSANRGSTSQFSLRPGRQSQGTATATTSRSRSPRRSLDAEFRVRDPSRFTSKSESHSARRRSTPSHYAKDILPYEELDVSFMSIPSRSQPSRRTKTANELIDRHLSFIPNGWRTILANTAKQLSAEDWDRSDARVLKKLEEHCPAFSNLEEILPDVKMAVPALRELMRELGRHP